MKLTLTIDISAAKAYFRHNELVCVTDKTNANYGIYGNVSSSLALLGRDNLRKDWREKLESNKPFDPEWFVIKFGGGYGEDSWYSLFNKSQIVNVRLLGCAVINAWLETKNEY